MVLDQSTIELIAFAGAGIGIAGRTIMPYLKARTENDGQLKFESKYVFAAAYAAVLSIAGSIFLWPQLVPTLNPSMSVFGVFVLSFTTGWTANDIVNFIQSSISSREAAAKVLSGGTSQDKPTLPTETK